MAQVRRLCVKVDSHLALFCIHLVNRVNSRNGSIIIIIIIIITHLDGVAATDSQLYR